MTPGPIVRIDPRTGLVVIDRFPGEAETTHYPPETARRFGRDLIRAADRLEESTPQGNKPARQT